MPDFLKHCDNLTDGAKLVDRNGPGLQRVKESKKSPPQQ